MFLLYSDGRRLFHALAHELHELPYLLLLAVELALVLIGLLSHHSVVGLHSLHLVDVSVALEDEHVLRLAFLIGQVVGGHLVVVGCELLQHFVRGEPPVLVCHPHRGVPPYRCLHLLADVPGKGDLVVRPQVRVDALHQHVPSGHALESLLVGMQGVVPLVVVSAVVCHQFLEAEVFLVLPGVVAGIAHLACLGSPLPLAVESADARVVAVYHALLLGTVEVLGLLLLGVQGGAVAHVGEHRALLQERVLVLRHQVVLHLDARRDAPAVLGYQSEHLTEALPYQLRVLVAAVARTEHALAHAVIGVVGFHPELGVAQLSGQIHVVHGDLTQ